MLAKRIIPCLDVREGRVVKGVNFVGIQDAGDPVEAAIKYDSQGADELVFLDITASSDKRDIIIEVVAKTAEQLFIPLTVGGGIRSVEDMRKLLLNGADKISINTAAIEQPDLINQGAANFGSQCIVVAVDAKRKDRKDSSKGFEIYTHGGRENTEIDAIKWMQECQSRGAGEILLTSMDCDGTKDGYDIELYNEICNLLKIPVIASGGAGNISHLEDVLNRGNADAVLAASIFHYNEYTVGTVKNELHEKGICVRL